MARLRQYVGLESREQGRETPVGTERIEGGQPRVVEEGLAPLFRAREHLEGGIDLAERAEQPHLGDGGGGGGRLRLQLFKDGPRVAPGGGGGSVAPIGTQKHLRRMQKALVQMNLQLHNVITDITPGSVDSARQAPGVARAPGFRASVSLAPKGANHLPCVRVRIAWAASPSPSAPTRTRSDRRE